MRERHLGFDSPAGPALPLDFAGRRWLLDHSGALYLPEQSALVVADLHLEKASRFAMGGQFLPPYDSEATLQRLVAVIARYQPARVITLGDSFHDSAGAQRLSAPALALLETMAEGRDWLWISGNHDPVAPSGLPGAAANAFRLGPVWLRHEPRAGGDAPQVCGHFHPVARLAARGVQLRRRCFAVHDSMMILPAFGALTGGLNVRDPALQPWLGRDFSVFVAGAGQLYPARASACLAGS
ncbi:MAG: ligase-associated DNA damage response endonuclease PdeM [Hyphomicrobiales bacterium]|nr:ligase-associated DNA damage response endonuclease PdeM [Hyphomicrobiales bacterium]